ncbi:MAG: signal peptidase I [Pseudomonadales bacterium]
MVDTLLITISTISLVIWFVQEKFARPQLQENLSQIISQGRNLPIEQLQSETMPEWNEWLLKAVFVMWIGWGASVVLVKDGDFSFILVILTLFSGLVSGLDKMTFVGVRCAYMESKSVVEYLAKYTQEQRDSLSLYFGQEMVVGEYAKSFFPVLAIVLVLRSFVVEPFQIPSGSMVPTLLVGDYILVNKYTFGLRLPVLGTKMVEMDEPKRGDVMVFFPPHTDVYFIKRVIGLPGDQVTYRNKQLTINGEEVPQIFLADLPPINPVVELVSENIMGAEHLTHKSKTIHRMDDFSITVKPGHYWMMGDNRDNSSDSRVWGQVPEKRIVGKAFAIWMHWPSFTQLPSFSRDGLIQ